MAGQMVHIEIPAADPEKAQQFWSGLFEWQFQAFEGSPTPYLMTRISDASGGAIYQADGDKRGTRTYFDVDDVDSAAARVRELGGQAGDKMPVPSMGWFAVCQDPEGNEFGLWQTDPNATM
jgi:predicted enzyme related to lactoylglutathione lyase